MSRWLLPFERHGAEPILAPDPDVAFERAAVYNPAVVYENGLFYMIYRAEDTHDRYISRLGLALSSDGVHFRRYGKNPIVDNDRPGEERGCEDPRVVKVGETFYMTYTAWDGNKIDLALAESKDLVHWTKRGTIIPDAKSGAILSEPVSGRYIMYFGDTNIWMATSEDLLHWEVRPDPVLAPRKDAFDSALVEPGPPPIVTDEGILLIYNSSDGKRYNVGQALFSKDDPAKLIARLDEPFLSPELAWEKWGKVNHVVFAESLVKRDGTWYLYYGGADKCVGLATCRASG
ncbi:MAG TPA: glycoside hydrolase family 130 protein [Gemmataceae bacterium]